MSKKHDYTSWARQITYRSPKLTFIAIQVNFWTLAFLLYSTLTYLNNLYLHEMGEASFPLSFSAIAVTSVFMGVVFGVILGSTDLWIDKSVLGQLSLGRIILIKVLMYPVVLLFIIGMVRYGLSIHLNNYFDGIYTELIESPLTWRYFYLSLLIYTAIMAALISFINQMNSRFGPGVLIPLFLGGYRRPREQERFFMFLDLRSSAAYAEKLGHLEYSSMIKDCFADLNNVLTKNSAEVYQYVGDEAVLTWPAGEGKRKMACLSLFFDFRDELHGRKNYYIKKYGMTPEFKAGLHYGLITAVEVGRIKRELAYHGDTINTAARIQSMCNSYGKSLLISDTVLSALPHIKTAFNIGPLGSISLKGKNNAVELFSVEAN